MTLSLGFPYVYTLGVARLSSNRRTTTCSGSETVLPSALDSQVQDLLFRYKTGGGIRDRVKSGCPSPWS